MRANLKQTIKWIGLSEGGYVNHPKDPGGATNMGITQRVYDAWRRNNGQQPRSVREITRNEADTIVVEQYLAPIWFDKLPSGLDYALADFAVNSGVSRAVKFLQRILARRGHDIEVDGVMGAVTMATITKENDPAGLSIDLCNDRMAFLRRLRTWKTFGKGWTRRVMGEEDGVQDRDTGVIDRAVKLANSEPVTSEPKPAPGKGSGDLASLIERIVLLIVEIIRQIFAGVKK